MRITLGDGYSLSVDSDNSAIEASFRSEITEFYSDGQANIFNNDGTAVSLSTSGDDRIINVGFNGSIYSKNNSGFVIDSEGSGGNLNFSFEGNMDVSGYGVTASLSERAKVNIRLGGVIKAEDGIYNSVGDYSDVVIENNAEILTENSAIKAVLGDDSYFSFYNDGYVISNGTGMQVSAFDKSNIVLNNNGIINTNDINFFHQGNNSKFSLNNSGEISSNAAAVQLDFGEASEISITNSGTINGSTGIDIYTSSSQQEGSESTINIINDGVISAEFSALSLQGAWADYYIENSGNLSTNNTEAIYVTGQKSFTLALKDGWNIDGAVMPDSYSEEGLAQNKIILTGDSNSSIDLSRFRSEDDDNAYNRDSILGINYLLKQGESQWTLTGDQLSGGFESIKINQGSVLLDNVTILMNDRTKLLENSADIFVKGQSTLNGSLKNSGSLHINNIDLLHNFNTLTVNGDYEGVDGSLILFNTVLGGDSSPTDRLIIDGNTSGKSNIQVNNLGGQGSKTIEGIELISVSGKSDGSFIQDGRIVAGAYDYSLVRGQGSNIKNWYLTSQINTLPVEPPVDPVEPPVDPVEPPVGPIEPPVDPVEPPVGPVEPPVTPIVPPSGGKHINRPEGGSYIANLAAANTLFNTRMHDHLGETQYIDALTGEKKVTSLWLRQVGVHNNWRDSSGQLKTQANSYVAHLGGDVVQWSTDGLNRGHLGIMTGYANSHNQTHSSVTNYNSKGSISGYSVGVYSTWFANGADVSGLYVDSWLQYSWFSNNVNGEKLASESYKSKGLTASVEMGYNLKMGEFTGSYGTLNEWFILPQAQATWMGVKADRHREDNGTLVNSEGDGNVQTRLGIRTYLKSHHAIDEGKSRTFEPFIEANWLHNTLSYSAKMDDVRISQAGTRNIGELKVGVEGKINSRLNLWGNVGTQVGDKGYNDSSATIGIKYNF